MPPQTIFIPSKAVERLRKRSLHRALRRAAASGETLYQGRPIRLWGVTPPQPAPAAKTVKGHDGPRVQVVTWNCSGLSQELQLQIFTWLRQNPRIGIFMLQETHWGFSNDYVQDGWCICHSATTKGRNGGIMIGVRQDLTDASQIRWRAIEPGRLVHWRGPIGKQHVDLISIYQHALSYASTELKADLMQKRRSIWKKLDDCIAALPIRSSVYIAGDFNTSLTSCPPVTGFGIVQGPQQAELVQERSDLMQILQRHRLSVLNSWSKRTPTYHHPNGRSQIDFIVIRQQNADSTAKLSSVLRTPLAGWRSAGHNPVSASIRINWQPWKYTKKRPVSMHHVPKLDQQLQRSVPDLQSLQLAVKREWDTAPDRVGTVAHARVDAQVLAQWRDRRVAFLPSSSPFHYVWNVWRRAAAQQSLRRSLKRLARQRKRDRILEVLDLAEQEHQAGHTRHYFQYIRMVAPKAYNRRIHLRSKTGNLMTPKEECETLAAYVQKLFSDTKYIAPPLLPLPDEWFTPEAWHWALSQTGSHKAVPKLAASFRGWKEHSLELSEALSRIARHHLCSSVPQIPTGWTGVQIAWLPKQGKSTCAPEHLRTIGLMGPDCKALMHILKAQATPWIQKELASFPQYAYRKGASTADPLLRATAHCSAVRKLLASQAEDLTSRVLGNSNVELVGGLMINLDLSRAFDLLGYPEMHESLRDTGMPDELVRVILRIHMETRLYIIHGDHEQTVSMQRGLRQGCPIAPIVYSAWTVLLCKKINNRISTGWAQSNMSIYADDKHCFWLFRSVQALQTALEQVKVVISCILDSEMVVNFTKSNAVLAVKGRKAAAITKTITRHWNGERCLRLRSEPSDLYIPLRDRTTYLGAILSYHNFESQTAAHRAEAANAAFATLGKAIRTSGALSANRRLALYKTCVWPAVLYGIVSVGVHTSALRTLISTVAMHLRKVLRVHEHGRTNASILREAGLEVLPALQRRASQQFFTIRSDTGRDTALRTLECSRAKCIEDHLQTLSEVPDAGSLQLHVPSMISHLPCPVCGVYFAGSDSLAQHIHRRHPDVEKASCCVFRREEHSLFGLPYCRLCHTRLATWQTLEKHISQGRCLRLKTAIGSGHSLSDLMQQVQREERANTPVPPDQSVPQETPLAFREHELFQVPTHELPAHASLINAWAAHCMLCGQRVLDKACVKTHWQRTHPAAWRLCQHQARSMAQSLRATFTAPCAYCGSQAKDTRAHAVQCSAMFQALSVRWLKANRRDIKALVGFKPVTAKESVSEPQ